MKKILSIITVALLVSCQSDTDKILNTAKELFSAATIEQDGEIMTIAHPDSATVFQNIGKLSDMIDKATGSLSDERDGLNGETFYVIRKWESPTHSAHIYFSSQKEMNIDTIQIKVHVK